MKFGGGQTDGVQRVRSNTGVKNRDIRLIILGNNNHRYDGTLIRDQSNHVISDNLE